MPNLLRCLAGVAGCALLIGLAVGQTPSGPARTNDAHAEAVELLRKLIKEQQRHPDRIIRTPTVAPASAANDKSVEMSAQRNAKSSPATAPRLTRAELEQQFLENKITAKQFQRALQELEKNPPPPVSQPSPAATAGKGTPKPSGTTTARARKAEAASPGKGPTNAPVATGRAPTEEEPEQKALSDVEAKIDEILARRQAQMQAARTNVAGTNAVPAGPMTKRQKLDNLLRQLIQGSITEPEYNAQREKLLAQPD